MRAIVIPLVAVKLNTEKVKDPSLAEMREVTFRTEKERCTLLVDLTINDRSVEAVVNSGAQVSVLSKNFYDSLDNKPKMLETIRLKGASASGLMSGCRVDKVDVDLGYGLGSYSMPMYVADINDDCILGLDYLKTRGAVIDLGRVVLEVEGLLVTRKYKYANDTSSSIHRVCLSKRGHLWPNSVTRVFVTTLTSGNQSVVIHGRNERRKYLVHNALMMSGDSRNLYLVNDSDQHIHLNTCTLVAEGEYARGVQFIVDTSASTGGIKNLEKQDGITNMTNTDVHYVLKLSADNKCSSALFDKSNVMSAHAFREILMSHLPDHMKYMFLRFCSELSNDQVLRIYSLLATKEKVFSKGETGLGSFTAVKHHIDAGDARPIKQRVRRTPLGYASPSVLGHEKA